MPNTEIPFLVKDGIELPVRESPLRFAVLHKDGRCSNSWTVVTRRSGDAYVMCRDGHSDVKVSLHQSGVNRIAFTSESNAAMPNGGRVWNEWERPQLDRNNPIVPMFRLIVPDWSLGIPVEEMTSHPSWKRIQVFAQTGHDDLVTEITFHLTDARTGMRQGDGINYPLAIMPVGANHKLWVMLNRLPETNLRQTIDDIWRSTHPSEFGIDESDIGMRLNFMATGYTDEGTGFMFTMPVYIGRTG